MDVKQEIEKLISNHIGDGVCKPGATLMPRIDAYELRGDIIALMDKYHKDTFLEIENSFRGCQTLMADIESNLDLVRVEFQNINTGINSIMPKEVE